MSGVGFFELVILFMIGLVVLGPKRLPKVASQIGSWVGQARRMTRAMKRQLEEELNVDEDFNELRNIGEDLKRDLTIGPASNHVPRDDDTYSPLHDEPEPMPVDVASASEEPSDNDAAEDDAGEDGEDDAVTEKRA